MKTYFVLILVIVMVMGAIAHKYNGHRSGGYGFSEHGGRIGYGGQKHDGSGSRFRPGGNKGGFGSHGSFGNVRGEHGSYGGRGSYGGHGSYGSKHVGPK